MFRILCAAVAVFLGGCAQQIGGVIAPTTAEISNYANDISTASVGNRPMGHQEYLIASIYYSNQKCDEFFDALARFQQDTNFVDKVLTAAVAAGTPLMAAYHASVNATAAVASSISYANNVNKFRAEVYAYAPYASTLRRHVKDQMLIYSEKMRLDYSGGEINPEVCIGNCNTELERLLYVRGQAQGYANICSLANMRAIIESSLANTQSKCTQKAKTAEGDVSQSCEAVGRTQTPGQSMVGANDDKKSKTKVPPRKGSST